jgi:hypothetical protein
VYPDGQGAHCFACGYHVHGAEGAQERKVSAKLDRPVGGEYRPLLSRKIDEKTCRMYSYRLARFNSTSDKMRRWDKSTIHVADYWRDGELVAQLTGVRRFELGDQITLYLNPAQAYVFGADGALLVAPPRPKRGN